MPFFNCGNCRSESAMKMYSASVIPVALRHQIVAAARVSRIRERGRLTMVPQTIIRTAIETGASTGPHQGSGRRNRTSQSNSDRGQPHITRRKT